MRVSLNTIKQYTAVNLSVDELVKKINEQLGGVEEVIDLNARYKDAIIVHVVSCEKHEDADKLNVCKVDDGGVVQDVPRDENGLVQVVCGAPNVHADMLAIWLPPKSTVPSSFTEKELFILDARELRGVLSQGMLASEKELALGDSHDGILEIDPAEWKPSDIEITPGASFAKIYGLDDTIIDIENKMFTHRPDLFGQLGVAREIAGIQQKQFVSPDWYKNTPEFKSADGLDLSITNEASDVVPRFMAVAIKDVTVKPSPLWLKIELVRLGGKPINNIVDVTNYIMLLTAQPTHAYDYDKLHGHKLVVRRGRESINNDENDVITLLNNKVYNLGVTDIVIADEESAVGLAGIMGGKYSEVDSSTKNIVLEVANFDMYTVRKSSMRQGVFTDALTRFNKGQSPLQNAHVLSLLMQSIQDVAGGEQASNVFDEKGNVNEPSVVEVTPEFINSRLGLTLSSEEITQLLLNVECSVSGDETLRVEAPFWRTDLEQAEDIVEEVGRLYGFDKLPRELPVRTTQPPAKNNRLVVKQKIRDSFSRTGANEVLTYSFVNEKVLTKAEQDVSQAFQLSNALSPDLQYYRLSVLPSLLDKVTMNVKAGFDEFTLFEIGKGHNKKSHLNDDEGLPSELEFVDAVYASKTAKAGAPFYRIRRQLTQLADDLGLTVAFKPISEPMDFPVTAPFALDRSAMVETKDGAFIGMVGELKQSVRKQFKLPNYTAAMTLDFQGIVKASENIGVQYVPLSRFPSITQDISLKVSTNVAFADIESAAEKVLTELDSAQYHYVLSARSLYQSSEDTAHKTLTLRLVVAHYEKTLKEAEVTMIIDSIANTCADEFSAIKV